MMNAFLTTIAAGIVGTTGMSLVMWFITSTGLANAAMIRAIGSMFTKSYENALGPGLLLHYISGILFAFLYVLLISLLSPDSLVGAIGAGAMIGIFHGVAFAFLLVIMVAEHHPIEQFRNAGFEVAIAHLVGHLVYGLLVGTVVGITGIRVFLID
ncbi:MAG: DUF6789 family protein [Thermodesulfobacteriota bacterium]